MGLYSVYIAIFIMASVHVFAFYVFSISILNYATSSHWNGVCASNVNLHGFGDKDND